VQVIVTFSRKNPKGNCSQKDLLNLLPRERKSSSVRGGGAIVLNAHPNKEKERQKQQSRIRWEKSGVIKVGHGECFAALERKTGSAHPSRRGTRTSHATWASGKEQHDLDQEIKGRERGRYKQYLEGHSFSRFRG